MKEKLYSLSVGQRTIAYAWLYSRDAAVNNIGGVLLMEDELDFELLAKSIRFIVGKSDALRLRIVKKMPVLFPEQVLITEALKQYFSDDSDVPIDFVDFSGKTMEEMDDAVLRWNAKPVDIFAGSLCRFTMVKAPDGRQGVYSKIDHLATDAWMSMLLCREIMGVYYALKRGVEPEPRVQPFLDFLLAEQEYLKSPQYSADLEYWLSKFKDKPHQTYITGGRITKPDCRTRRFTFDMGQERSDKINEFCRANKISPSILFHCVMAISLGDYTRQTDVSFFSAVMLRSTLKEKRTCGPLINSFVARMDVGGGKSFLKFCQDQTMDYMTTMRHLRYPMLLMMQEMYKIHHMQGLSDVLLSFQSARIDMPEPVKFETKWYPTGAYATQFTMNVMDMDNTGRYILESEYQTAYLTEELVRRFHETFVLVMDCGVNNPETAIDLLLAKEPALIP